jgi:hypothetical protein
MHLTDVWENLTEDDVIDSIEEAYSNTGCEFIQNLHKYDRRHEGGVDLICLRAGETTYIQVKIRPRQKDIKQLEAFSRTASDKKIYVYVSQPSRPFKDHMDRLEGRIDFWNAGKLHDFLISNRSQLYIRYIFLDSQLLRDLYGILVKVFSYSKVEPAPLDTLTLRDWWDLKDRAVKLHASLEHLHQDWKDEILSQDSHDPQVLKNMLEKMLLSFSIISSNCSKDLLDLVTKVGKRRPDVLSCYVAEVLQSSSWIGMGSLKDKVEDTSEARNIIFEWVLPSNRGTSEFSLILNYLENLHHISGAIEDGVDFVFRDSRLGSA